MDLYWPTSSLTESERIQKTASRVGLSVPGASQEAMMTTETAGDEGDKEFVSSLNGRSGLGRKSPLIDRLMRDEDMAVEQSWEEPKRATN